MGALPSPVMSRAPSKTVTSAAGGGVARQAATRIANAQTTATSHRDTESQRYLFFLCVSVTLRPVITYCSNAVVLRFGTKPTGIFAISFIDFTSTTETSLVTGLAT